MGERGESGQPALNRAVFLDRDGVINRMFVRDGIPFAPTTLEQFAILPGVVEAIAALKNTGFRVIVATNQPDVGAGKVAREIVEAMNARVQQECRVDDVRVCYHTEVDRCACRKPKPGLLVDAARDWSLDLRASYMVGDRWRDIVAGHAAGCRTVLIDYNYSEQKAENPDIVVQSLEEASQRILSEVKHAGIQ
ncbi:MAG: HAD family hydrolase [Verrucomicrobiia bacterium]|jgi:D-glycero-D-manno-heptose 1,7-bisphosphate phosphatase